MAAPTATIAVVNLKGGAGKTTTAAFVAHALHEQGRSVVVVDADPQESALTWSRAAPWPGVGCIAGAHDRLARVLPGMAPVPDIVVIDTPPRAELGRGIILSAVRAATHVLVPIAPTPVEYEQLRELHDLLAEAEDRGARFRRGAMLVRTVAGANSTAVYREAMENDGWLVLRAAAPRLEEFAQAFGEPITRAAYTGYGYAVDELLEAS